MRILWWRTPKVDPAAEQAVQDAAASNREADQRLLGAEQFVMRARQVQAQTREQRRKNHLDEMFVEAILGNGRHRKDPRHA